MNKPTAKKTDPPIEVYRRASGLAIPPLVFADALYHRSCVGASARAITVPTNIPRKASPACPSLKPNTLVYASGIALRKRYKTPHVNETHREKDMTTGSVKSRRKGRASEKRTMVMIL